MECASHMAQLIKNPPAVKETQEMHVQSMGWEDHLERTWHPTAVFLPGKSHGQKSLVGCSLWAHKDSDMTWQLSTGHGDIDQIFGS